MPKFGYCQPRIEHPLNRGGSPSQQQLSVSLAVSQLHICNQSTRVKNIKTVVDTSVWVKSYSTTFGGYEHPVIYQPFWPPNWGVGRGCCGHPRPREASTRILCGTTRPAGMKRCERSTLGLCRWLVKFVFGRWILIWLNIVYLVSVPVTGLFKTCRELLL